MVNNSKYINVKIHFERHSNGKLPSFPLRTRRTKHTFYRRVVFLFCFFVKEINTKLG